MKHYSKVTKLVHFTSKFVHYNDGQHLNQHPSTINHQLLSTLDMTDRFVFLENFLCYFII